MNSRNVFGNLASRVIASVSGFVSRTENAGQSDNFQCMGAMQYADEMRQPESIPERDEEVLRNNEKNPLYKDPLPGDAVKKYVSLEDAMIIHEVLSEPVCKKRRRRKR